MIFNNITRYYIYGLGLLAMATPTGQVYTYHYNGIGSTIAMTDQNKNVVNKYFYTPFGLLTNQEENVSQPFKFAGQHGVMYEPNGFYYMRARYYDPSIGRFISEDPSGFDGGDLNLYAYCNDNPINRVDPSGLEGRDSIYAPSWLREQPQSLQPEYKSSRYSTYVKYQYIAEGGAKQTRRNNIPWDPPDKPRDLKGLNDLAYYLYLGL